MPRILYLQYTNPAGYPPLEHSSRILANKGWQVLFLGTGAFGSNALRFAPHDRITVRQIPFRPAGWLQKGHYIWFSLWSLLWTLRWRPDWVYASDPLSCPVALLLSLLPGVHAIYHEHDSPVSSGGSLFQCSCLAARRRLVHRAEVCILPNQRRTEDFASELDNGHNVLCVWNCPSLEELSAPRLTHGGSELWVLYHGSIVPSRLPPTILQALKTLPDAVKLRVIGYETVGHIGYVSELREKAARLGISGRIEFVEALPRSDLLEWCRKCDVGLAFMPRKSDDPNEQAMVGASNKPFDYLSCGLALLVSELPDWRQMYTAHGFGLACDSDDPESIASALRWFLEHPEERRRMGELGRKKIENEWNYETQFAPVLERMNAEKR